MVKFRHIFSRGSDQASDNLDIEDLITLRRFDEAETRLRATLELRPKDVYLRLKLAEVYTGSGELPKAVDQYFEVVDCYADDGFYDKGLALLSRVHRLAPKVRQTEKRIKRLELAKKVGGRLEAVVETLLAGSVRGEKRTATALVRARGFRQNLAGSHLVESLGEEQLRRLFAEVRILELETDSDVASRGAQKDELYLVAEGGVAVEARLPAGGTTVLREFLPGDIFGERALLEHQPWAATYTTTARSLILAFDRHALEKAMIGNPNPRELIEALRAGGQDAFVAKSIQEIENG